MRAYKAGEVDQLIEDLEAIYKEAYFYDDKRKTHYVGTHLSVVLERIFELNVIFSLRSEKAVHWGWLASIVAFIAWDEGHNDDRCECFGRTPHEVIAQMLRKFIAQLKEKQGDK